MRLGILHDSAAQERMAARDAEAATKKKTIDTPTVRTEAEQRKHDAEPKKEEEEKASKKPPKPTIRPLSEARAIDLGANFASEAFIFMVAAGLLVFERWWSRRKETAKDEGVVERLTTLEEQTEIIGYLEAEVQRLKAKAKASEIIEQERSEGKDETKSVQVAPYPRKSPKVSADHIKPANATKEQEENPDGKSKANSR